MVAVTQASPAQWERLVVVSTAPSPAPNVLRRPAAAVYRRRQAVAVLVVVSVITALVLAVGGLLASFGGGPLTASERPGAQPASVYVVQPGDTFWEIARRLDPEGDPRPLVARLVAAHGSPVLVPGERLALPASG